MDDLKLFVRVVLFIALVTLAVVTAVNVLILYGRRTNREALGGWSILNNWWLLLPYFPSELADTNENRKLVRSARITNLGVWVAAAIIYLL